MTWPAMMRRQTAIAYLDLSEPEFEREIAAGRIPDGVLFGGKPRWYRAALDKALEVLNGDVVDDHLRRFEERLNGKQAA